MLDVCDVLSEILLEQVYSIVSLIAQQTGNLSAEGKQSAVQHAKCYGCYSTGKRPTATSSGEYTP